MYYYVINYTCNVYRLFYVYVQKRQSNVSPQTTVFQSLSKSYSNLDINQSSVPMKKVTKFLFNSIYFLLNSVWVNIIFRWMPLWLAR